MSDQKTVNEILAEIKATTSRNAKIEILEENKENETLKAIIKAAIDPFVVFYITDIPDESYIPESFQVPEDAAGTPGDQIIVSILHHLESDFSRSNIRAYFAILGKLLEDRPDDLELTRKMLKGDLDCGIAASTVNKVWPDLINTFKVMKAEEKAHLDAISYPALASVKMDGVRAVAFYRDGNIEVKSSSGLIFQKVPSIEKAIQEFADRVGNSLYDGFILDGEIVAVDKNGNVPRQTSNGLANKALKGTISDEEEQSLVFFAFDILSSASQLERGMDGRPLKHRLRPMIHIDDDSNLREVHSVIVDNEKEALFEFKTQVKLGEEGIVLKSLDGIYEAKRSKHWIKLKKEFQCEVEIVDWKPHSKKANQLGGISVKTADGKVIGDLGTKLSDQQRIDMYALAQEGKLIGQIATIMFHDLSSKRNRDTLSFYLPRFIELRNDKDEADTLATLRKMM